MTTAIAGELMTADELFELPDDGFHRYELHRGRLICMSPSAALPGVVAGNFLLALGTFVRDHRLGIFGTADSGFKLASDPDTVRAPDVWFVRAEQIPSDGIPNWFWRGAPDLAVEVLSPSDRFQAVILKVQDYLDAGTRLVWVFDPVGRTAAVFPPNDRPRLLDEDGVLDGGDVIPGFTIRLRDILP